MSTFHPLRTLAGVRTVSPAAFSPRWCRLGAGFSAQPLSPAARTHGPRAVELTPPVDPSSCAPSCDTLSLLRIELGCSFCRLRWMPCSEARELDGGRAGHPVTRIRTTQGTTAAYAPGLNGRLTDVANGSLCVFVTAAGGRPRSLAGIGAVVPGYCCNGTSSREQAMRSPLFPAGSVCSSSALA